jgi:cytoskeletal protein RodZ
MSESNADNPNDKLSHNNEIAQIQKRLEELEIRDGKETNADSVDTKEQLKFNRWIVILNIVLVAITIVMCGISVYQAYLSRTATDATKKSAEAAVKSVEVAEKALKSGDESSGNTLTEMKEQSKAMQSAAEAGKRQAVTSKIALETSIQMSRNDQRAWVGPVDTTSVTYFDQSRKAYVEEGLVTTLGVIITNSGKTPALEVTNLQRMDILPAAKRFVADYPGAVTAPSTSVLQPGAKVLLKSLPSDKPIPKEFIDRFANGELILYFHGFITYKDIFAQSHKTTFCSYMGRDLKTMNACETYNEAN